MDLYNTVEAAGEDDCGCGHAPIDGSAPIEAHANPPGNPLIDSVSVSPSNPAPGDTVDVTVHLTDHAGGSGFVNVFAVVQSDQLDQPVLWMCTVLAAGGSTGIGGSSIDGTGDGSFVMPDGNVTLDVTAGGYTGGPCADTLLTGTNISTWSSTVEPTTGGGNGGGGNGGTGGTGGSGGSVGFVVLAVAALAVLVGLAGRR